MSENEKLKRRTTVSNIDKNLNARLAIVGLLIAFIFYIFVIATILTGFPPDTSLVKIPSEFTRLGGIGGIVFALCAFSLGMFDARDKVSSRSKWSIVWLAFSMLSLVSFSSYFLFYDVLGLIGLGYISFLIAWISFLLGALFYRKLDNKNQQESQLVTNKEIG